jgi:TolA-binding protein
MNARSVFLVLFAGCCALAAGQTTYQEALDKFNGAQYGEARAACLALVAAQPADPRAVDAQYLATICLYYLKDYDGFATEAEAFRAAYPASAAPENLDYLEALIAFDQERWSVARMKFEALIAKYPDSQWRLPDARYYAAVCLYNDGEFEKYTLETRAFRKAYPDYLDTENLDYLDATLPFHAFQWELARALLNAFIEKYPDSDRRRIDAEHLAALCLFNQGRYDQYRDWAREFLVKNPESPLRDVIGLHLAGACLRIARPLEQLGRGAEAVGVREEGEIWMEIYREMAAQMIESGTDKARYAGRIGLLMASSFEEDYDAVVAGAREMADRYDKASAPWAEAMLYVGLGLALQEPANLPLAAEAFDVILESDFTSDCELTRSEILGTAVVWRISIGLRQDDMATCRRVMDYAAEKMAEGPHRKRAMTYFMIDKE